MRTNPHILEINTRSWLKRLEAHLKRPVTLADVPDEYWQRAKDAGFDAIWFMGVWKLSPAAEKIARENKEIQEQIRAIKPDFKPEDITASPYAVYEYEVDDSLGGNAALAALRAKLNGLGINLLLDFVGNHTAIDSPTVHSDPELYINTGTQEPATHKDWFFKNDQGVYIAHGRDPYFAHPEFIFIAEVYWGLEWDIQEMGFDYTYDKVLYDRLRFSNPENIKGHLGAEHLFQMRSIRFTANHDEEESLKAFGKEKSLAASTIIATLPGARMFHLFQLLGRPERMPIQYIKDDFAENKEVLDYYLKLLHIASDPAFHGGQWSLRDVAAVAMGDDSHRNILAWQWKQRNTGKMIVINYSSAPARGRLSMKGVYGPGSQVVEELTGQQIEVTPEMLSQGYELQLKPYESKIFTYKV